MGSSITKVENHCSRGYDAFFWHPQVPSFMHKCQYTYIHKRLRLKEIGEMKISGKDIAKGHCAAVSLCGQLDKRKSPVISVEPREKFL